MTPDLYLFPELRGPAKVLLDGDDVVTEGNVDSWAIFSADGVYRYLLGRQWDPDSAWLVVGMLNPSSAGAFRNDPTIRRLLGFARRDGYGGLLVWNAMAMIATNPHDLLKADDPAGPRNPEAIRVAMSPVLARCVVGWGRPRNKAMVRAINRAEIEARSQRPLWRFGDPTKDGWPRHPLYLRAETPIVRHSS